AGLEWRHGVGRVADEKDSAAVELISHPLEGLPRRDVDDFHVDRLTDRFRQQFAATMGGELFRGFPAAGQVGGDEHAEVVAYRQKDALHVRVFDLDAVAAAQPWDKLSPRPSEVDEDDKDRQRPIAGSRHAKRVADRAVYAVGRDE